MADKTSNEVDKNIDQYAGRYAQKQKAKLMESNKRYLINSAGGYKTTRAELEKAHQQLKESTANLIQNEK